MWWGNYISLVLFTLWASCVCETFPLLFIDCFPARSFFLHEISVFVSWSHMVSFILLLIVYPWKNKYKLKKITLVLTATWFGFLCTDLNKVLVKSVYCLLIITPSRLTSPALPLSISVTDSQSADWVAQLRNLGIHHPWRHPAVKFYL